MKTFSGTQTRHAIYDPDREQFVSKHNNDVGHIFSFGSKVKWTDVPKDIWSHVEPTDIIGWCHDGGHIKQQAPRAHVVEIVQTILIDGRPYQTPEKMVTYAKQVETYKRLKPEFDADADAMKPKDWEVFKAARVKLKSVGILDSKGEFV